jgi:hypothetical protein
MSHLATFAKPAQRHMADLSVVSLSGQVSTDQFHDEEIDLFGKTGTGIAEGSSVSSCDVCFSDSGGGSD